VKFISTRSSQGNGSPVSFAEAVLNCIADDGGMYVPAYEEDLSRWILYMTEDTSFQSIAGALTSSLIHEEFSPIISEAIAMQAFPFSPELKKLDESHYVLELFHGKTGCYKDFGISYLASCLEHILLMQNKKAVVLAVTNGETGASIANAFRGKKHLKAVLLYTKGTMRYINDADCIWNGGNILPVEVDGTEAECFDIVRSVYSDRAFVKKHNLTLANTVNIGRILPLSFCYMYAFSRLKAHVAGDIFYSVDAGNYGNLAAGLYSWKFSLPVNGFITNCTNSLVADSFDKCCVMDSMVPLNKRSVADPANPSNIERIEQVFQANPMLMKSLIFPAPVTTEDRIKACKDAFIKYGYVMDPETAAAYAAAEKRASLITADDGVVVLVARNHPALSAETIRKWCGEVPVLPADMAQFYKRMEPSRRIAVDRSEIIKLFDELEAAE